VNVAGKSDYARARADMKRELDARLAETKDPRALGQPVIWDDLPFYGEKRL
jgi:hypothetical protein